MVLLSSEGKESAKLQKTLKRNPHTVNYTQVWYFENQLYAFVIQLIRASLIQANI